MRFALNPAVRRDPAFGGLFPDSDYADVAAFFATQDGPPTPLRDLPSLAADAGIGALLVKDESARFGVNAFKIVGVSYAVHRLGAVTAAAGVTCATAGNHGRAVARVARDRGIPATIFLPETRTTNPIETATRSSRVAAMIADGARVISTEGTYEEAVARASAFAAETGAAVISDTSWPGYEEIPRWIMAGYTRLFDECSRQWSQPPDVVIVQGGVGGLVCAAASWFAHHRRGRRPFLIACEPESAACLLASSDAGRPVSLTSPLDTIMAGLRCAEPSAAAWPAIAGGIDAFMTVDDVTVVETMERLASLPGEERVVAGPSGACSVAAARLLARAPALAAVRAAARMDRSTRVLAVITEGA